MVLDRNPIPVNERERLAALSSYHVLDTLPEEDYDAITRLASYICQTPIALISLIDTDRQWFKSKVGLNTNQTPRTDAFCRYTIMDDAIMEIPDAAANDLFADNVLVTGDPNIRFYAGAPLIDPDGYRLGSLCVIDRVPRTLNKEQKDALSALSKEVVSHLALRKKTIELNTSLKLHAEFYNLFNNSPEIHCVMDRNTNILLINDSITRILGFSAEDAIGKPIWHFVPREDQQPLLHRVEEGLRTKVKTFELEIAMSTRSGEERIISWAVIAKDDNWYASGRDITEQKKVLAELKQLSLVASKVSNGVVISDANNKVMWINDAFEQITGYNLKDVQNNKLGDVLKGELTDTSIIQKARELSENKQSFEVDLLIYRKDGSPIWISIINSIILNKKGETDRYVEVIIDITAKKKVEIELIAAREEAMQLNRAKDMFISVMSHEIRTPLNAVIGISNLLMDENKDPSQNENLKILQFSSENLMNLINDILDFTKAETGNLELEKANVDLRELVNGVVNSMLFKAQAKHIYLVGKIDEDLPQFIIGDKTRLIQILLNLTGNALKFTDEGGITIGLKVLEQAKTEITIRFEVADTGIGIREDKMGTIFESFKQAESDITRLYGGTGLGLAITKRLVELHKSHIHVESVYGSGSKFWFNATFTKSTQKTGMQNNSAQNIDTKIGLKLNVLVVDDNQVNRFLTDRVLTKWGVTTDFAENGLIAIEKLENNHSYDLVLMDMHMPEMGGIEATQVLRSKEEPYFKNLPIIALTASMLTNQLDDINKAGMNDYILKPFDPKVLYDKISRYQKPE